MKWLKECYRNVLYTRITKSKAQRLIKSGQGVYAWVYDNMGYVDERIRLGIFKDDIYRDIEYVDYLIHEYKGRVRFYLKEEKKERWKII